MTKAAEDLFQEDVERAEETAHGYHYRDWVEGSKFEKLGFGYSGTCGVSVLTVSTVSIVPLLVLEFLSEV